LGLGARDSGLGARDSGLENPCGRGLDHVFGAALGAFRVVACMFFAVPIVVHIEPAVQPEPRVEDEGTDECPRTVAVLLE
jgi:hypothetical protein